ncbi:Anhydro-N-acetylmuramic acid kinase [Gammaproteobacteria bacterium]
MNPEQTYVGLMSGTSLDGLDAVLVNFGHFPPVTMARHFTPYQTPLQEALRALATGHFSPQPPDPLDRLGYLDSQLGDWIGDAVMALLETAGVSPLQVRAIGSHGQTIRHRPQGPHPFTLQIGDPNRIAERTGIPVVADLRRRDMAAGGQGAPLLPIFHDRLFRSSREHRAVLNLGGIANLTLLSADPSRPVQGFDTGPANTLLDAHARQVLDVLYDVDGHWASNGQVNAAALEQWMTDPYFEQAPPKSTGPEYFHPAWVAEGLQKAGQLVIKPADHQATLVELTAASVARALQDTLPECQRLLVCGGGVHNRYLMARLVARLAGIPVESTEVWGVDPDFIEATAFAWLAQETLHGRPGNLPSVTGARQAVILGSVYPGAR